jgi:hypothetical protein
MTVEQTDVVDFAGVDEAERRVVLAISDHKSWDEPGHIKLLQDKINAYLGFIESGQVDAQFPRAVGYARGLLVYFLCEPSAEALEFLAKVRASLSRVDLYFEWQFSPEFIQFAPGLH